MLYFPYILLTLSLCANGQLPTGCLDAFRYSALQAHNDFRLKHSVGFINEDFNLDSSAQKSASNMAITNIFSHTSNLNNTGENIFAYYTTLSPSLTQCARNAYKTIYLCYFK